MRLQYFFWLACCAFSGSMIVSNEDQPLQILVLQDCFPNSSSSEETPAALAAEWINNQSSWLPGFTLSVLWQEVDCFPYSNSAPLISALAGKPGDSVVGVISSTQLRLSGYVASLLAEKAFSRLHISLGGVPSHKFFPLTFSMLDSSDVLLQASIALIDNSTRKHANILFQHLSDGRLPFSKRKLQAALDRLNVTFNATELSLFPNSRLKFYQLHLVFADIASISAMLCTMYHLNLKFPTYEFVFVVSSFPRCELLPLSPYDDGLYACTVDQIAESARGALVLQYDLVTTNLSAFLAELDWAGSVQVQSLSESCQGCLRLEPLLIFDAVLALSLALNNSLPLAKSTHTIDATAIRDSLQELSFTGLTGRVNFSDGYCSRNVAIYQFSNAEKYSQAFVGLYSTSLQLLPNFERSSASDKFLCPFFIITPPKFVSIISFVVAIGFLVFVLTFHVLTLYFRRQRSVKKNSYKLTQLTYIGCYLLISASLINTCLEGYPDSLALQTICDLWPALNCTISLGLTFIFGSLSVRTWRLYRILIHFRKPGRFLSDHILISGVFLCVFFDVIIFVVWSVVDPFVPHCLPHPISNQIGTVVCTQINYFIYILLLMTFNLLLMIACSTFALLTVRKYSINFQLQNVVCGSFWSLGTVLVGFPTYFMLLLLNFSEASLAYRYTFLNCMVLGNVAIVCVFILVPPLVPVLKEKMATQRSGFSKLVWFMNEKTND